MQCPAVATRPPLGFRADYKSRSWFRLKFQISRPDSVDFGGDLYKSLAQAPVALSLELVRSLPPTFPLSNPSYSPRFLPQQPLQPT